MPGIINTGTVPKSKQGGKQTRKRKKEHAPQKRIVKKGY